MYWLLSPELQDQTRNLISQLVETLITIEPNVRQPYSQFIPFSGRKARNVSSSIIGILSNEGDLILDPFMGSGTFLCSSVEVGRRMVVSDIDPFIIKVVDNLFSSRADINFNKIFNVLSNNVQSYMNYLYGTTCVCGNPMIVKAVYFDLEPLNYLTPTHHERIFESGENVVLTTQEFNLGIRSCPNCRRRRKILDDSDFQHILDLSNHDISEFPNPNLIINSRINITLGRSDHYGFFFTHRTKLALIYLWKEINKLINSHEKELLKVVFLSTLPRVKITDYRTQSQDLYFIPNIKCKENNVWWHFQDKINDLVNAQADLSNISNLRLSDIDNIKSPLDEVLRNHNENKIKIIQNDFRTTMDNLPDASIDLLLTDPPYTDQVPHLERHQLYYPWLNLSLDQDILSKEVIISNAPSRPDKSSREQYFDDIAEFFQMAARVLKTHKYLIIYFHPAKIHWTQDFNYFKLLARINGLEPIQTIDISRNDPTVRKQASTAWEINDEIVLVYLKVAENERYWFDGDYWIDKTIYRAAVDTAQNLQGSFSFQAFISNYHNYLRRDRKLSLTQQQFTPKIQEILGRYADFQNGLYTLKRGSPFDYLIGRLPFIQRIRDFTPLVIEELLSNHESFTYPDFLLKLHQYLDNGEKEMIIQLQRDERLIETTLNQYIIESDNGTLIRRPEFDIDYLSTDLRRTNLFDIDPYEFERLIQELLTRMNFSEVSVVGRSGDRGIDIVARDPDGTLFLIQVKRWRFRVPATPIQRLHSACLTRGADRSWVITTSQYTPDAIDEATNYTHTKLTNGVELMQLLEAIFPGRFRLSDG